MKTNDHEIKDYSATLEKKYGEHGSVEREKFNEQAYAFYSSQLLLDARKKAKITQAELARRIDVDKSYISRIEKGITLPSVAVFYKIANAMGFNVELRPLA